MVLSVGSQEAPYSMGKEGRTQLSRVSLVPNGTVATVSMHLANTEIIIAYIEKTAMWLCTTYGSHSLTAHVEETYGMQGSGSQSQQAQVALISEGKQR